MDQQSQPHLQESHSIRLRRAGSAAGTPAGMSPGGATSTTAVSPPAASVSAGAVKCSPGGGAAKQRQRHFTFDFREPDAMEVARAQRLERKFHEKLGAKCAKYELVAGFHLEEGVVISYHPFRTRVHFELTERRRKILGRYYRQAQQEVLLYVDRSEFEYYSPVCCYQPPQSPNNKGGGRSSKRRDKASTTSCFAISGCAS